MLMLRNSKTNHAVFALYLGKGKKEGKDPESIKLSTTLDPGHHMGK